MKRATCFRGKIADRPFFTSYAMTGEVLGKGGYGIVWRGRELSTGRDVAIKVVALPAFCSIRDMETEFEKSSGKHYRRQVPELSELETMAAVGPCPGLLELDEAFIEEGKILFVTDIMAADLCDELMSRTVPFREADVRKAMYILLSGIGHCHAKGVSHRDIKLDNIFLKTRGDLSSVRLGDFGLAHMKSWGKPHGASGSMQYMAPEVAASTRVDQGYDGPAADMWSIGVVMFSLLAKRFPFSGTSGTDLKAAICNGKYECIPAVWESISPEAKDLLQKLLTVNPLVRCTAVEALNHKWFDAIRSTPLSDNFREKDLPRSFSIPGQTPHQIKCSRKPKTIWRATITLQTIMKQAGLSSPIMSENKAKQSRHSRTPFARLSPWYATNKHVNHSESAPPTVGIGAS